MRTTGSGPADEPGPEIVARLGFFDFGSVFSMTSKRWGFPLNSATI